MSKSAVLKHNQGFLSDLPLGTILPWHRDLDPDTHVPALPAGWVECHGQVLADEESPFNGKTLPDLNGEGRFLRGGASSGELQDDQMRSHKHHDSGHAHSEEGNYGTQASDRWRSSSNRGNDTHIGFKSKSTGTGHANLSDAVGLDGSGLATGDETRPKNMTVIWIMKIKQVVATHAISVVQAEPNAPSGAVYVSQAGHVGIGTGEPRAKLEVRGSFIRQVFIATGIGPQDETDPAAGGRQIVSRVLNFTKVHADTAIRILYCDNLRVQGNDTGARWEIRIDGAHPPGGAIFQDKYVDSGNNHDPATILGYATGVPAGSHQIQIWVNFLEPGRVCDALTGWYDSRWTIEAQEVWIE